MTSSRKPNSKLVKKPTQKINRSVLLEGLEARQLMAIDAIASWLELQEQPLLGETIQVGLQFRNSGNSTGYGPYMDLIVPRGSDASRGIQYVSRSAAYLDSKLQETIVQFDKNGLAQHPFATDSKGKPLSLTGNAGDQLVVLELPFGSFVSGQPAVEVAVQLAIGQNAELGQSMSVVSASGFRFGGDALNNVSVDPMIRGQSSKLEVKPGLVRTKIEYLGPEDETATGKNFLRSFRVDVDVAEGASIENLALNNLFDSSQAFLALRDVSWGDALTVVSQPEKGVVGNEARLDLGLKSWKGQAGVDGSYIVDFFVPNLDGDGKWTADPIIGTAGVSKFSVQASGSWNDSATSKVEFSSVPATHLLEEQVIAVQQSVKTVSDVNVKGLGPSDVLEYTIDFQVSDYASIAEFALKTSVPNGQRLLSDEPVAFTIAGVKGYSNNLVNKSVSGLSLQTSGKDTGALDYQFNVSRELEAYGLNGEIHGGATAQGLGGAVTGRITYRTVVLDSFEDSVPSGDLSIDEGDKFATAVLASARTINPVGNQQTEYYTTDDSSTLQRLAIGNLTTTVYAVNGIAASPGASVKAGDLVTYRITREVRSSDIEHLELKNYLPLPIYQISDLKWLGSSNSNVANSLRLGPSDSFHKAFEAIPGVSICTYDNLVSLKYGSVDSEGNSTTTIDLLLTLSVEDQPFADGMWLTSMARSEQGSSNNGNFAKNAITNVLYTRPVLSVKKAAVSSSNPAAVVSGPSGDTNVSRVDAGDLVRFQVVVENTGLSASGAFDVQMRDAIPAGFAVPTGGLQFTVTDAAGNNLAYRELESGLLGGGIQLLKPLASGSVTDGSNKLVVSYELRALDNVRASAVAASSAEVVHYAAVSGGNNYVTSSLSDFASVAFAAPTVEHTIVTTDQSHTEGTKVVIGETVTYRVRVAVPEVTMSGAMLRIDLPRGVAINKIVGISTNSDIQLSPNSAQQIISSARISNATKDARDAGRILELTFGDLVNSNRDNASAEYIDVVYTATVTNDSGNNGGNSRSNTALWKFDSQQASSLSTSVTIVEPRLQVTKSWSRNNVDAQDQLTVTIDVKHHSASAAAAFDAAMSDSIPSGTTYVPGSLRWVSGPEPLNLSDNAGIQATWATIPFGTVGRLQYSVVVNDNVHAGEKLANQAAITWTSLPGSVGQIASSNSLAVERAGNTAEVGGTANTYRGIYNSSIAVAPAKISMSLLSTSHSHTSGDNLAIGERATYLVTITVPEGVHTLDFNSLQKIVDSSIKPESMKLISIGANLNAPELKIGSVLTSNDGKLNWKLGTVTNKADNKSSAADRLVFELTAVIPDISVNAQGDRPELSAQVDYRNGVASATSSVGIVEPTLRIVQSVKQATVDAADVVDAVMRIEHKGGTSNVAFDLNLVSLAAQGLQLVPGSVTSTVGKVVLGNGLDDSSIRIETSELKDGQVIEVQYKLAVGREVLPGSTLTVASQVNWQSIAGETGRDYSSQSSASLNVNAVKLGGWVFVDANQDGVQQLNDLGLFEVPITLSGIDHLGNKVQMSVLTDPTGRYEFDRLRPGTYQLVESQPQLWFDGLDWAGTAGGVVTQNAIEVTLKPGLTGLVDGYNFTESMLSYISGTVFFDEDENGILGQDEDGISGIEVTLSGKTETGIAVDRKVTTNSRGYYVFGHLEPGTYSVTEGKTDGYFDAAEQLGSRGGRVENDAFHDIKITASQPGELYNFGEYRPGSFTGQIYIDYDRDFILDRRDGLLANVDVVLTGTNDIGETIREVGRTDENGQYYFGNLRPGMYALQSAEVGGLNFEVSNLGLYQGAYGPNAKNGVAVEFGFTEMRLPAGAKALDYNIGHVDPTYDPSILQQVYEGVTSIVGTDGSDRFVVSMTTAGAQIQVGVQSFKFDASESRSFRLMGSFGNDTLDFTGSEYKEEIDLRKHSARINGTWFETLVYGMEQINFVGGGNEDLARFYDTDGNDTFVASRLTATMKGEGYQNQVDGVHRIYAYGTTGSDVASLTGAAGQQDKFSARPGDSRLYGNDFYLYASGFDDVTGYSTDETDRAYLYGSDDDDQLLGGQYRTVLQSDSYKSTAEKYTYTLVAANQRGKDSANLVGSKSNDWFRSRPTEGTFDVGGTRIIAQGFEVMSVEGQGGNDSAEVYDTHYQDAFSVAPGMASLVNRVSEVSMVSFENVSANMSAGGDDLAFVTGSSSVDTFKAHPDQWSMQGGGNYFFGSGFTKVTAQGSSNDVAYLYDSAFNDLLELASNTAQMSGQLYSNLAVGFGKVNAEATSGDDRVMFMDDAKRATIRMTDEKATIFGTGFSHNSTGFDHLDAFFADLVGRDNVELLGHVQYQLMALENDIAKYKLSVGISEEAALMNLKTSIENLLVR